MFGVDRFFRHDHGREGYQERGQVREHMARVGKKSEGSGSDSSDHFQYQNGPRDADRPKHAALAMVAMGMKMRFPRFFKMAMVLVGGHAAILLSLSVFFRKTSRFRVK